MCIYTQHNFTETDMPGQSLQIGPFEVEPGHMVTYLRRQIINRSWIQFQITQNKFNMK